MLEIKTKSIRIKDIVLKYTNDKENGVFAWRGKLNIRPAYQREFIYEEDQEKLVIDTILRKLPLNSMYWVKHLDDTWEVLDGQQRTISICEFFTNKFSIEIEKKDYTFNALPQHLKDTFLNYELKINICESDDEKEIIEWFERINVAGKPLTKQEILNAIYFGPFVTDAKKWFSKESSFADMDISKIFNGNQKRQDYLETILKWCAQKENKKISTFMSEHRNDENSIILIEYLQKIWSWIDDTFEIRSNMKGINWGELFEKYKTNEYNREEMLQNVSLLLKDNEITRPQGIYEFLLSGKSKNKEKLLNLRSFTKVQKESAYERCGGKCECCSKSISLEEAYADHRIPWSKGGKTIDSNLRILCLDCNIKYSNKNGED